MIASPWIVLTASSTPSVSRTMSTISAGICWRSSPPNGSSIACAPRTWPSTFALTSAKRSSKAVRIVSVNTRVPEKNATPRITATAVRTMRIL
jgi:hypothetical protein